MKNLTKSDKVCYGVVCLVVCFMAFTVASCEDASIVEETPAALTVTTTVVETTTVELDCVALVDSLWKSCLVTGNSHQPYYNTAKFSNILDSLKGAE